MILWSETNSNTQKKLDKQTVMLDIGIIIYIMIIIIIHRVYIIIILLEWYKC